MHPVNNLTNDRLKDYFVYCMDKLGLTENTLHSRINAVKFYFEQVLKQPSFMFDISRPKKRTSLPPVFSKEDIEHILKNITNKKHKTMLLLAYSAGLRVSEVVALRIKEIDSYRMIIRIIGAKGKKDRIIPLSKTALKYIKDYIAEYKPSDYLFEGQDRQEAYSKRSLQMVLEKAKLAAGINRKGSIHALRHSYATHLIDKGVDITYIQKLLGHNDLKTTLRYLHVTTRDLNKIESPAEDLDL
jgi:site-specific recombinase XerD